MTLSAPAWEKLMDEVLTAAGEIDLKPTSGMQSSAKRALDWIKEGKGGGGLEESTKARARDIAAGKPRTPAQVSQMHRFFSRHASDKKADGWNAGDKSFPSPGRVAHELWGGDSGKSWSESKFNALKNAGSL